jgi:hypothetical protein
MKTRIVFYCSLVLLSGCIMFTAVPPGEFSYSGLNVTAVTTWNQAPKEMTRLSRSDAKTWTKNGILLDRILIIPAVPDGEPLFRQVSGAQALPLFDANMLPNELSEFTESSILKLFGEGGAVVGTSNMRPHRFGKDKGIIFNLEVKVSDGPDYKGVTGAVVAGEELYLIVFLGAEPYYYEKSLDEAIEIIEGSHVIAKQ